MPLFYSAGASTGSPEGDALGVTPTIFMETENTNTLEKVRHAASDYCHTAVEAGRGAVTKSVKFVRKNPVGTIAGAVAVGFLVA